MLHCLQGECDFVDWSNPVQWSHALNHGLTQWLLATPSGMGFGSATWRSLTGYQHSATLTNIASPPTSSSGWSTPFGRWGGCGALKLDGSNDYARFSTPHVLGFPFTVAAWSRVTGTSANYLNVVSVGSDTANRGWASLVSRPFSSTVHRFGLDTDANDEFGESDVFQSTTAYTAGWNHVCAVMESATSRNLYINGQLLTNRTVSVNFPTGLATGSTFLGARNLRGAAGATTYHNGYVDDVRIWNRGLSPTDVLEVYRDSGAGYPATLRRIDLDQWFADTVAAAGGFKAYWAAWRSAQIIGGGLG